MITDLWYRPYVLGAFSAVASALLADKYKWRMPFIASGQVLVVVAYAILFAKAEDIANNVALCYFAIFLALFGLYPIPPGSAAWCLDNLSPKKRATGVALYITVGNLGGIIGSFIFLDSEKPAYPTGYGTSLGLSVAGLAAALGLEAVYWSINKSRANINRDEVYEKYTEEELQDMHENSPLFKYKL